MARKHKHEDHINHEAWAIPYGDLITLLLAFFVVMYSMSSVNEGKYRVLSDSLKAAFGGPPRSTAPIQVGPKTTPAGDRRPQIIQGAPPPPGADVDALGLHKPRIAGPITARMPGRELQARALAARHQQALSRIGEKVHAALGELIAQDLVVVRRTEFWLEVEIQTDLLFASGSAQMGAAALPVLDRLAGVLQPFPNRLRIEGHTDNVPISTREFASNWELSSARAASVVHRFARQGVDPRRMTVTGLSEYQPAADNGNARGRNQNRRVVIVVLAEEAQELPSLPTAAAPAVERNLAALGPPQEHAQP